MPPPAVVDGCGDRQSNRPLKPETTTPRSASDCAGVKPELPAPQPGKVFIFSMGIVWPASSRIMPFSADLTPETLHQKPCEALKGVSPIKYLWAMKRAPSGRVDAIGGVSERGEPCKSGGSCRRSGLLGYLCDSGGTGFAATTFAVAQRCIPAWAGVLCANGLCSSECSGRLASQRAEAGHAAGVRLGFWVLVAEAGERAMWRAGWAVAQAAV